MLVFSSANLVHLISPSILSAPSILSEPTHYIGCFAHLEQRSNVSAANSKRCVKWWRLTMWSGFWIFLGLLRNPSYLQFWDSKKGIHRWVCCMLPACILGWILLILICFRNQTSILLCRLNGPMSNPQSGGAGTVLSSGFYPLTCPAWLNLPGILQS